MPSLGWFVLLVGRGQEISMATGLVGHVVVIWMVATALQAAETKAAAAAWAWLYSVLFSAKGRKAGRKEAEGDDRCR